jgi:hypothetical protein
LRGKKLRQGEYALGNARAEGIPFFFRRTGRQPAAAQYGLAVLGRHDRVSIGSIHGLPFVAAIVTRESRDGERRRASAAQAPSRGSLTKEAFIRGGGGYNERIVRRLSAGRIQGRDAPGKP